MGSEVATAAAAAASWAADSEVILKSGSAAD
jgi:hypothetical protein